MKLIVTDLDGTLLNDEKVVSEENSRALKRAIDNGFSVAIASGRGYSDIKNIADSIKINPYIISSNGGYVYDKDGKIIKGQAFDKNIAKDLVNFCKNKTYFIHLANERYLYVEKNWREKVKKNYNQAIKKGYDIKKEDLEMVLKIFNKMEVLKEIDSFDEIFEGNIELSYGSVFSFNLKELKDSIEYMKKYSHKVSCPLSGKCNYEIINKDATKGHSLDILCDYLKINPKETIAFGDNFNDITMLKKAGLGVAMGNAENEIKEIADIVTEKNNNHGVAEAINNLLDSLEEIAVTKNS
ncbi:Cof-type HAD-IIB family hydrolase [Clostridium fallax]|uniref:Cof subfamily of IIB subfamily of haloacid dehalogenase superfamily/HAD-superfamily hydrolase, subfamily IIB n=1 Tax=Clostridium fallax TaxID=1533 RepID=A0A1M4YFK0_9CLOT|nr:Cof-type HAD-IIB family hydrolase [Clostridium fallax]SHF04510.1 hypothetical protein SAMN05443638_12722 [Clostridium fallax]SQB22324.1 HAD superfamily hydrolase [Clostridium fallax]